MVAFIDIEIIDLYEHLTERYKDSKSVWRFCFRLSQSASSDWKQLFNDAYYKERLMGPIAYVDDDELWTRGKESDLRTMKWWLDRYVKKTNAKYRRLEEQKEKNRLKKAAKMRSMRDTLFSKKQNRK